jgi:hypothetical protein
VSNATISWILFVIIGSAAGVMRYCGVVSPQYVALFPEYGPFLFLAMHVIIILKAFADSVYQGILCLLIPFYSFYYLFLVSDAFYLRAIFGGLLVGIGWDSCQFYQKLLTTWINRTEAWILKGGE